MSSRRSPSTRDRQNEARDRHASDWRSLVSGSRGDYAQAQDRQRQAAAQSSDAAARRREAERARALARQRDAELRAERRAHEQRRAQRFREPAWEGRRAYLRSTQYEPAPRPAAHHRAQLERGRMRAEDRDAWVDALRGGRSRPGSRPPPRQASQQASRPPSRQASRPPSRRASRPPSRRG